jgi:hypothetical protein
LGTQLILVNISKTTEMKFFVFLVEIRDVNFLNLSHLFLYAKKFFFVKLLK